MAIWNRLIEETLSSSCNRQDKADSACKGSKKHTIREHLASVRGQYYAQDRRLGNQTQATPVGTQLARQAPTGKVTLGTPAALPEEIPSRDTADQDNILRV